MESVKQAYVYALKLKVIKNLIYYSIRLINLGISNFSFLRQSDDVVAILRIWIVLFVRYVFIIPTFNEFSDLPWSNPEYSQNIGRKRNISTIRFEKKK